MTSSIEESEIDFSPTDVTLNLTLLSGRVSISSLAFTNIFESVKRALPTSFLRFSVLSTKSSSSPGFKVDENFKIEFSVNEKLSSSPFLMNAFPSS